MKKRVLLPFSTGFEEIEFVCIVDILRRAGMDVCTASLDGQPVLGRSNIKMHPDLHFDDAAEQSWDAVVLPGGLPNAHILRDHAGVQQLLQRMQQEDRWIAAICAAPTALAAAGVIGSRQFTCYPGCQEDILQHQPQAKYCDEAPVVEETKVITSQGPGTAMAFALHLVQALNGREASEIIRQQLLSS